jgi:hypothetical protein
VVELSTAVNGKNGNEISKETTGSSFKIYSDIRPTAKGLSLL